MPLAQACGIASALTTEKPAGASEHAAAPPTAKEKAAQGCGAAAPPAHAWPAVQAAQVSNAPEPPVA